MGFDFCLKQAPSLLGNFIFFILLFKLNAGSPDTLYTEIVGGEFTVTKQRIENLENRIAVLTKKLELILNHITGKHEKENCTISSEQSSSYTTLDSSTSNSA